MQLENLVQPCLHGLRPPHIAGGHRYELCGEAQKVILPKDGSGQNDVH